MCFFYSPFCLLFFIGSLCYILGNGSSKPFPTLLMHCHQLCIKREEPQPQVFVTNTNSRMHACASSPAESSTIFISSTNSQLVGQDHQLHLFLLLLNSVWGLSTYDHPYSVCIRRKRNNMCPAHKYIFFEDYWTTLVPNSVKLHLNLLVYFCFLIQSQWLVCFVYVSAHDQSPGCNQSSLKFFSSVCIHRTSRGVDLLWQT
jgi:hypothetical protein